MARPRRAGTVRNGHAGPLVHCEVGGFEWSDVEHTAASIWNRAAAPGAKIPLPPAMAAATTLHLKLPAPAFRSGADGYTLALDSVIRASQGTPTHGYGATCEAAVQAFAKSWRRESQSEEKVPGHRTQGLPTPQLAKQGEV